MKSILRFLGLEEAPSRKELTASSEGETETVRKITHQLDSLPPDQARYIAAFAYILGRVANADLDISQEETRAMEEIVVERAGLPREQAIIVVQMAKSQNLLFGGTENYLVTREFNKIASKEQKIALVHCLFAVSSSDESVSLVEDNEIGQISRELGLEHREFIQVRSKFRDCLSVLKEPGVDRS
ncbi:MAG: TerB family tellurite resistance protein [Acidobacteriota bacterium]